MTYIIKKIKMVIFAQLWDAAVASRSPPSSPSFIYRVVLKNCPLFENSRPNAAWQSYLPMHSPISQFGKVLAKFSQLSAIYFAQPCRCCTRGLPLSRNERGEYRLEGDTARESVHVRGRGGGPLVVQCSCSG